jgi:hypothetical protein
MPITYSTILYPESYDLANARADDLRFGFVVSLPYRLRVGAWYRQEISARGKQFTLWLLNRVAVSEDEPSGFEAIGDKGVVSDLWTEALLVLSDTDVSEESMTALRLSAQDGGELRHPRPEAERFAAMEAINHFVIGYATATNQLYGGSRLRLFYPLEFSQYLRWELALVSPAGAQIEDSYARSLFDLEPDVRIGVGESLLGDLDDLPAYQLAEIKQTITRHRDFLFYEFAFDAKTKKTAGDSVGALLMAVAAYETVHGAFVARMLMDRLPPHSDPSIPGEYLRQLGMDLCNKLTPYMFIAPDRRPDPVLINRGEQAIHFRNEIMHGLRNRRGVYRRRLRTNEQLSGAYRAAIELYDFYRAAFESLPAVGQPTTEARTGEEGTRDGQTR